MRNNAKTFFVCFNHNNLIRIFIIINKLLFVPVVETFLEHSVTTYMIYIINNVINLLALQDSHLPLYGGEELLLVGVVGGHAPGHRVTQVPEQVVVGYNWQGNSKSG